MENEQLLRICKTCGFEGAENYCARCGNAYITKRISMHGLFHDIFHLFTHLDKGFGYTIKQLIVAPGTMQREYIEGNRSRYQKPFSMFLICATISGLVRYWIIEALIKYFNAGNITEGSFFHEYMFLFHAILLPVYALLIYSFFYKSGYNYAEITVFAMYSVAFLFLVGAIIFLLKFIWPDLDTAYIEMPFLLLYTPVTYINFFRRQSVLMVALKSILIITLFFLLIQKLEDTIIEQLK